MGKSGDEIGLPEARRGLVKEIYAVVEDLVRNKGWRLKQQGHKYAIYCPCGADGAFITLPGTPRKAGATAKMIRRKSSHCPDRHELM